MYRLKMFIVTKLTSRNSPVKLIPYQVQDTRLSVLNSLCG
jgi:hypothetical protein